MTAPWTDAAWLAAAHAWIREHAPGQVLGTEQPHVRSWATALRVETTEGVVWFKANSRPHRHEAAVTALLGELRPGEVPEVLARDDERGWLLARDAGERLRELVERERSLARWLDVLPLYAGLQMAAVPHGDELVTAGVPDRRLEALPMLFEQMLDRIDGGEEYRRFVRQLAERCERLAAFRIPETIQHDDLHDAQVFVRDGGYLVTDWGDSVVAHPFLSMSVTLEGVIAWGVDDVEDSEPLAPYAAAYLRPFGEGLEEALALALPLGWACRCVGVYDHSRALPPEEREGHLDGLEPRLQMLARDLAS